MVCQVFIQKTRAVQLTSASTPVSACYKQNSPFIPRQDWKTQQMIGAHLCKVLRATLVEISHEWLTKQADLGAWHPSDISLPEELGSRKNTCFCKFMHARAPPPHFLQLPKACPQQCFFSSFGVSTLQPRGRVQKITLLNTGIFSSSKITWQNSNVGHTLQPKKRMWPEHTGS